MVIGNEAARHDRALISKLAIRIWYIDTKAQRLEAFRGTYDEWRVRGSKAIDILRLACDEPTSGETDTRRELLQKAKPPKPSKDARQVDSADGRRVPNAFETQASASKNAHKRMAELILESEQRVGRLEASVSQLTDQLQSTSDYAKIKEITASISAMQQKLDAALAEWERAIMANTK